MRFLWASSTDGSFVLEALIREMGYRRPVAQGSSEQTSGAAPASDDRPLHQARKTLAGTGPLGRWDLNSVLAFLSIAITANLAFSYQREKDDFKEIQSDAEKALDDATARYTAVSELSVSLSKIALANITLTHGFELRVVSNCADAKSKAKDVLALTENLVFFDHTDNSKSVMALQRGAAGLMANCYLQEHNYAQAYTWGINLQKLDPTSYTGYHYAGVALAAESADNAVNVFDNDAKDRIIQNLEASVEKKPENNVDHMNLAEIYIMANQPQKADRHINSYRHMSSDMVPAQEAYIMLFETVSKVLQTEMPANDYELARDGVCQDQERILEYYTPSSAKLLMEESQKSEGRFSNLTPLQRQQIEGLYHALTGECLHRFLLR